MLRFLSPYSLLKRARHHQKEKDESEGNARLEVMLLSNV